METQGFVAVNGIRIHYDRSGTSERPAIVLAHGLTDNGKCWSVVGRELARDYNVISYDARGHGLSDKPSRGYCLEDHENDLTGLIAALGLEKPILMGHSMGGGIVARTAADHPALARAVILVDPAYFPRLKNVSAVMEYVRTFLVSFKNSTRKQSGEQVSQENPRRPKGERSPWVNSKFQFTPRILQTLLDLPNVAELLPRIEAPVLLLKADASHRERQKHVEAASGMRNGKLVHIDGAGHNIHRDRPAATLAAIREFLDTNI